MIMFHSNTQKENRFAFLPSAGVKGIATGLPGYPLPPKQQLAMRRAYYAAVAHTDEQIGRVLGALDVTGAETTSCLEYV